MVLGSLFLIRWLCLLVGFGYWFMVVAVDVNCFGTLVLVALLFCVLLVVFCLLTTVLCCTY